MSLPTGNSELDTDKPLRSDSWAIVCSRADEVVAKVSFEAAVHLDPGCRDISADVRAAAVCGNGEQVLAVPISGLGSLAFGLGCVGEVAGLHVGLKWPVNEGSSACRPELLSMHTTCIPGHMCLHARLRIRLQAAQIGQS